MHHGGVVVLHPWLFQWCNSFGSHLSFGSWQAHTGPAGLETRGLTPAPSPIAGSTSRLELFDPMAYRRPQGSEILRQR